MNRTTLNLIRLALIIVALGGVTALDYYSGYEVRLSALYAAAVGLATWNFGAVGGAVVAVLAATLEFWAERLGGKIYTAEWIGYSNALSRLCIYFFVALSFSYFRRTIALARKRVKAFEGQLKICACCQRVDGGEGFWMDFPTYIRKNSEAVLEFDTCPTCVREGQPKSSPSRQ